MNPKYPSNLDPKLREAYDRVMGTGVQPPKSQQQPDPHHQAVTMVTEPAQAAPKHQEADNDSGVIHYGPDTHPKHKKLEEKPEVKQAVNAPTETKPASNSSATPILIGVIGVLFLLGYALFWAQIFGFNILPSL